MPDCGSGMFALQRTVARDIATRPYVIVCSDGHRLSRPWNAMKTKRALQEKSQTRRPAPRLALWVRLLVAILSPVAFLLISELLLWAIGYGRPSSFFIPHQMAHQTVHLTNRSYCEHFVPPALSRAPESSWLSPKDEATIRVFVLGGSAAFGDPDPAFGFCRQLELLLNEYATGPSFEVVNVAVTSMNSHVARRIARDCVGQEPDAFIVFMGNNEVVGPYGPPTLPAGLYASRRFINLSISAKKDSRLGQLVSDAIRALRDARTAERQWMGMEAFLANQISRNDERMEACYRHFQDNIRDIVETAHTCGAATILCTVPTNVRSSAPFASQHRVGLEEVQLAEWTHLFAEGRDLQCSGDFEAALARYEQARQTDSRYADLSFCMGTCLLALGRADEAKPLLLEARDLDTLRFRADSPINDAIRRLARNEANRGATLCDLETYLEERAKDQVIGDDLLTDHVHLNFRGNFLAAFAAMAALDKAIPRAGLRVPEVADAELLSLCRSRLLYDDREAWRLATVMYRRKTLPPFEGQLNHEAELARLRRDLLSVYGHVRVKREPESWYLSALEQAPFDSYLNIRYGDYLLNSGRTSEAIRAYQKILAVRPGDRKIRIALGKALAQGGMEDEALEALTDSEVPNACSRREALLVLGTHYVKTGRISEAATVYEQLSRIDPDNPDVWANLAAAASHAGDLDRMKRHLDQARQIAPQSARAMIGMGNYYAKKNQPGEARKWFGRAVQADPQDYLAHVGLGIQSIRLGRLREGMKHVERAVVLKPDFARGYDILAAAHAELGEADEARRYGQLRDLFQSPQDASGRGAGAS